jgi:hypothetical protein
MEYIQPKFVPCQAILDFLPNDLPEDVIGKRHHPLSCGSGIPNLLDIASPLQSRRNVKNARTKSMVGMSGHLSSQYERGSFLRPAFPQTAFSRDLFPKWLPQAFGLYGGACGGTGMLAGKGMGGKRDTDEELE